MTSDSGERLRKARVPRDFWDVKLSDIPDTCSYKITVGKYVEGIADFIEEGKGLYLFGDPGSGKTSAAVICLKAALGANRSVMFVPASTIVQMAKVDYVEGTTFWDRAMNVHFAILDGAGEEYPDTAGIAMVNKLMAQRAWARRPTIITSSLDPRPRKKEQTSLFELRYGSSAGSRLRGKVHPVLCDGKDWRQDDLKELARRLN